MTFEEYLELRDSINYWTAVAFAVAVIVPTIFGLLGALPRRVQVNRIEENQNPMVVPEETAEEIMNRFEADLEQGAFKDLLDSPLWKRAGQRTAFEVMYKKDELKNLLTRMMVVCENLEASGQKKEYEKEFFRKINFMGRRIFSSKELSEMESRLGLNRATGGNSSEETSEKSRQELQEIKNEQARQARMTAVLKACEDLKNRLERACEESILVIQKNQDELKRHQADVEVLMHMNEIQSDLLLVKAIPLSSKKGQQQEEKTIAAIRNIREFCIEQMDAASNALVKSHVHERQLKTAQERTHALSENFAGLQSFPQQEGLEALLEALQREEKTLQSLKAKSVSSELQNLKNAQKTSEWIKNSVQELIRQSETQFGRLEHQKNSLELKIVPAAIAAAYTEPTEETGGNAVTPPEEETEESEDDVDANPEHYKSLVEEILAMLAEFTEPEDHEEKMLAPPISAKASYRAKSTPKPRAALVFTGALAQLPPRMQRQIQAGNSEVCEIFGDLIAEAIRNQKNTQEEILQP